MQSGIGTSDWCTQKLDEARAMTTAFAVVTGCYHRHLTQMVSCFRRLKPKEFIKGMNKLYVSSFHSNNYGFGLRGFELSAG